MLLCDSGNGYYDFHLSHFIYGVDVVYTLAFRGMVKCGVWASSSFLFNSDPIFKLNAGDHVGKQLIAS